MTLTDGTVEVIDNPSDYPDPARDRQAGGAVRQRAASITPTDYVGPHDGAVPDEARRASQDMKYMDANAR